MAGSRLATEVAECLGTDVTVRGGHSYCKQHRPANEAYHDETRQALDRAILVDLLGLPETILEPLRVLREQWCSEPTVHGGKSTRPR